MTVQLRQLRQMHQNFNSHPHEEDDGAPYVIDKLEDISTHILTKRMTAILSEAMQDGLVFQLTSSRRG